MAGTWREIRAPRSAASPGCPDQARPALGCSPFADTVAAAASARGTIAQLLQHVHKRLEGVGPESRLEPIVEQRQAILLVDQLRDLVRHHARETEVEGFEQFLPPLL